MTTKIKWRLAKLPTVGELALLVHDGILTKEQGQEILFSLETEEDRDKQSLQDEIKFLRQLVQSLSTRSTIVDHIYSIATPNLTPKPWYQQYQTYCSSSPTSSITNAIGGSQTSLTNSALNTVYLSTSGSATTDGLLMSYSTQPEQNFTDIKTF